MFVIFFLFFFLMSWPPTLTPTVIKMELVVASSRGRNIGDHLHNPLLHIPIRTHFKKSASFNTLTNMASSITQPFVNNVCPSQPIHVYFLAGLPNITSFDHSKDWNNREVLFTETAQEACNRVVADIEEAESTVLGLGAIPCFCTVAPMSLRAWNTTRLHKKKHPSQTLSTLFRPILRTPRLHPKYASRTRERHYIDQPKNLQNQRKQWNVYTQNSWTNL